jgi:integrase
LLRLSPRGVTEPCERPLAPEYAELLSQVPESERRGQVFQRPGVTRSGISHVGCAIGQQAAVHVRKDPLPGKVKYASFHDLRRSCALRRAKHLMPQELTEFMRHSPMQVTLDYYVGHRAMTLRNGCGRSLGERPASADYRRA